MAKSSTTTQTLDEPLTDAPADAALNPVSAPVEPGPKVETMDDLGIKPTDPYPTGSPPAPTYAEINGLTKPETPAK